MADSKKPADQDLDQSDDLIAELARIVADDAKRASVSQSIEQRAQKERPTEERKPTVSSGTESSSAKSSAFSGQRDRREQRQEPTFATPAEPKKQEPAEPQSTDPFEFDFASSYRAEREQQQETPSRLSEDVERLVAEAEREPRPEPVAPQAQTREERQSAEALKQEVNAAAEVDEIAELISKADETGGAPQSLSTQDVEAEQLKPVEPQYDHESDALFADEPYMEQEEVADQQPQAEAATPAMAAEKSEPKTHQVQAPAAVENDPLAEIERLIQHTSGGQKGRSPHSYLETPGDQTGRDRSQDEDPTSAAEAAILAAMAAARPASDAAEPPKAKAPVGPAPEAAPTPAAEAARQSSAPYLSDAQGMPQNGQGGSQVKADNHRNKLPFYAGGIAALLLLGLGGVTVWNFIGGEPDGDVPLVTAQNTDVKQTPENTDENTDSPTVFSALEGQPEDTSSEQIVSRDDTGGASGEGVSRVITPSSNNQDSSSGLTNRKVKTVTVLADGTIVTGDEASAGAQQLPDIRPNVPDVSGGQSEGTPLSDDPIGQAIQSAENAGEALTDVAEGTTEQSGTESGEQSATDANASEEAASEQGTGEETATTEVATAPTPPARPQGLGTDQPLASAVLNNPAPTINTSGDDQPLGLVPDSQPATPAPQTSSAPVNATTNPVSAPFYVQLASQRSPEAAQQTVSTVSRQYANALGGQTVGVNRVDLDDRGTFYRVLVPANSIEAANAICNNVKASGGDCFVRNN
ncbi:SPOR domain-containing protein [Maritalea mediterranea]|uniref:SPOR domain-containing protein n=1 Tax=Maritalea mediterranea TaxID=2909667 RepID=A0ABS9E5Z0_9HYPH|nr:SPOR domain-containing protein [Maritalea mediterranea]MCF4098277.1 SPOR domain-containing protein [Maritalea mediterranea]